MAEAHSAVAFSFSITHEGWDVNFDREVLHLVWQSGVRSWKKRFARFKVKDYILASENVCVQFWGTTLFASLCAKPIWIFIYFGSGKNISV